MALKKIVYDRITYFRYLEDDLIQLEKTVFAQRTERDFSIFERADLAQQFRKTVINFLEQKDLQPLFQKFLKESLQKNNFEETEEKPIEQSALSFCENTQNTLPECINKTYFTILNSFQRRGTLWGLEGDVTVPDQKETFLYLAEKSSDLTKLEDNLINWMLDEKPKPETGANWQPLSDFFKKMVNQKIVKTETETEPEPKQEETSEEEETPSLTPSVFSLYNRLSKMSKEERETTIKDLQQEEKNQLFQYIKGLVFLLMVKFDQPTEPVDNPRDNP